MFFRTHRIQRYTEFGLMTRAYECNQNAAMSICRRSRSTLYSSEEEYVRAHSGFADLVLANFHHLIQGFSVFCSSVLGTFWLLYLAKVAKERCILIRFLLSGWFIGVLLVFGKLFKRWSSFGIFCTRPKPT